mgnify:CR=1 FL=1
MCRDCLFPPRAESDTVLVDQRHGGEGPRWRQPAIRATDGGDRSPAAADRRCKTVLSGRRPGHDDSVVGRLGGKLAIIGSHSPTDSVTANGKRTDSWRQ